MTGSRYLVEAAGSKLLVDCGLYQEREFRGRNWDPFAVPPESIDAVLLTHAHLDHVGYLPRLGCKGFAGPIHATPATAEIAKIVLLDSGHIQEEDARKKRRRHKKESRRGPYPVQPLYTEEDAEKCVRHFSPVKYQTPLALAEGKITATWHDAGHILGSAMLTLDVRENGEARRILFSGDVGRWDKPILRDPTVFEQADYVVVESTYANRKHKEDAVEDAVAEEVNRAYGKGGNLVIPSFSVERAHEIMYVLNELLLAKRIPQLMVFIDSPMAIRVTEVFKHHPELFDEETIGFIREGSSPFEFPGLTMTRTVDESKSINDVRGTRIIIAGSGMCTGGRIKHHLVQNINVDSNTIMFIGYQARGTLGRHIVEGAEKVRIFGRKFTVRARIAKVNGFSGHADRDELMKWLGALKTPPRHVFVTHGEEDVALGFSKLISERMGWEVSVPGYGDEVELE